MEPGTIFIVAVLIGGLIAGFILSEKEKNNADLD
jgi:hypothetical protein